MCVGVCACAKQVLTSVLVWVLIVHTVHVEFVLAFIILPMINHILNDRPETLGDDYSYPTLCMRHPQLLHGFACALDAK